ncbi:DUF3888 domain-containing protein [Clostridium sp. D53t1_180928_C8]|uniref:DUF3888 domain-containing protein n=1 Tax=Clostridium sp. D53t1_180928_C8 TaxID=2787101 RepID=UPI0018ABD539|nr:DUF3888 domain-containing protein [Clostridium sp. D53t1_180928_C8]
MNKKNIQRPEGDSTFNFIVKIQVTPFVGAHKTIGIDNITIEISALTETKVLNFEHLKSYDIISSSIKAYNILP